MVRPIVFLRHVFSDLTSRRKNLPTWGLLYVVGPFDLLLDKVFNITGIICNFFKLLRSTLEGFGIIWYN